MIEELEGDLANVIEDFDRAVNVEALRRIKETSEHLFLVAVHSQLFRVEQEVLLGRLEPIKTNYHQDLGCMDGTREILLKQVIDWATKESRQNQESNMYWIYGLPGIGKTSLAHSICARLHKGKHLAGAYFCQRDDASLSEPRNILPTLIYKLAGTFPPFRSVVAEHLRNDPHLTPGSMNHALLHELIRKLPRPPKRTLVFLIDAVDECGNNVTRPRVMRALTDATAHAPWLKIIITSRPEADIHHLFNALVGSPHEQYDLASDEEATSDIRLFARVRFERVASEQFLPSPWPEPLVFDQVISRAAGLFIFIETIARSLEICEDPTEHLKATLEDGADSGLKSLYRLYSSILKAQIVHNASDFRQMIGVVLAAAVHRPLCEETIAELAGVRLNFVKMWMAKLGSLLYRDEGVNCGIRVRHLSISDFFLSDDCPSNYHVELRNANVELGVACLKKMIEQLRFNICKLEDSRVANADVDDLPSRIKENISDALQYSCLYWSNHLCFDANNGDQRVWESLRKFFEGPYGLFWIEALSVMERIPIGVPSLRRVISRLVKVSTASTCIDCILKGEYTLLQDVDLTLAEKIEDVCRFINTFWTAISMSAPHTYISTGPFLPSESHLSATVFRTQFTKGIQLERGRLSSWPSPPLEWIGHTRAVRCVRYSPNGCYIISGSEDMTIRMWDAVTGSAVGKPLEGHTGWVTCVAYSPDGRYIISGSEDTAIRMWDAEAGSTVGMPLEGHTGTVWSIAYSPDGRYIISGSADSTIRMWDAVTGSMVSTLFKGHALMVLSVAYSPDGRNIVSGSSDHTVTIWDAETRSPVGKPLEGHTGWVLSVAYSPDGRHIVSGSSDKVIRIWDAGTRSPVGRPLEGHIHYVFSVAYSPDGCYIISGSWDKTIRMWDAETGYSIGKPFEGHVNAVWSVAYSPDGYHIVSGSLDNRVRMWDARTGYAVGKPLEGHSHQVYSVAYSPDGRRIISGCFDKTIRMWDAKTVSTASMQFEGHTNKVFSIAYSPNGRYIISGSEDKTIRMWDAEAGSAVGTPLEGHTGTVWSVAYSPDGRHIISGSEDTTIRMWDAKTSSAVGNPLKGHTSRVLSVAYSPDGRHIISGSPDKTIRIWDAETGSAVSVRYIEQVFCVSYSPDGRHIIFGSSDSNIRIWDAETLSGVGEPLEGHTGGVVSVACSPNGRYIISGSYDKTIRMWDAETGSAVGTAFEGHTDMVWSVAYSPDGRHIISGSIDGTILVWDANNTSAVGNSLQAHCHQVQSIPCSPDCRNSASGSADKVIQASHLAPIRPSPTDDQIAPDFHVRPDQDGWVRDTEGGLLYWVPYDCLIGLRSTALLTIPLTTNIRSISLNFDDFVFGTSWTQIFVEVDGSLTQRLSSPVATDPYLN